MTRKEPNAEEVNSLIAKLENLNYAQASIEEIRELLEQLTLGFMTNAPRFEPGVYLHRIRKCSKPTNIREATYPPKEYATIGRANDEGKPMFYASVGKSVPYSEIYPEVGDEILLSTWKSTSPMMLNHIGYTDDVKEHLNSNRDLSKQYSISDWNPPSEIYAVIYKFLGKHFTLEVNESAGYKLTVAIANLLCGGDIFAGLIFPTVQVFGNSDNIVLKPDFVDANLQLVSVEFQRVTHRKGLEVSYQTLDFANDWDAEGNIKWSGRLPGYMMEGNQQIFESNGEEHIAKNPDGTRRDMVPTNPIIPPRTPIESAYLSCYPSAYKINQDKDVKMLDESVTIKVAKVLDFNSLVKFLICYIPKSNATFELAKAIASSGFYEPHVNDPIVIDTDVFITNKKTGERIFSKDLTDLKRTYVYADSWIDLKMLASGITPGYSVEVICGDK